MDLNPLFITQRLYGDPENAGVIYEQISFTKCVLFPNLWSAAACFYISLYFLRNKDKETDQGSKSSYTFYPFSFCVCVWLSTACPLQKQSGSSLILSPF